MKKNSLKEFYNSEAKKYYESRKKPRYDGEWIINEIKSSKKKEISILEFGCGGGRLINNIKDKLDGIKIKYIGVDISENLLDYAKKDNPNFQFVCDDISNYIKDIKQESFDFIIGICSFQHISTYGERLYLMKYFYKGLKYGGKLIMTNWSFSQWFLKKYQKEIISSFIKTIYTFGKHKFRDIDIPRKSQGETKYRYYHIFTKNELNLLSHEGGFITQMLTYLDKKGQNCNSRKEANNTLLIGKKEIYK